MASNNDTFTDEPVQAQVMLPSALEAQTRAEFDVSIVTAHRFPRSISTFLKKAESMATATPEIAAAMEYAKPIGNGREKIKGPSTRLAEIVAACYGNLRVQARIISETNDTIVAQGVAHDLETNVAHSTEVSVSIVKRDGTRYGPEQIQNMRGSACSKARRNATFLVVPAAMCLPIISSAKRVAAGDAATLPQRRAKLLEWFEGKGIKTKVILDWLEVKDIGDIDLEKMSDLIAAQNSARDEGVPLAELFAKPKDQAEDRMAESFGGSKAPVADIRLTVAMSTAQLNGLATDKMIAVLRKHGGKGDVLAAIAGSIPVEKVESCVTDLSAAAQEGA